MAEKLRDSWNDQIWASCRTEKKVANGNRRFLPFSKARNVPMFPGGIKSLELRTEGRTLVISLRGLECGGMTLVEGEARHREREQRISWVAKVSLEDGQLTIG